MSKIIQLVGFKVDKEFFGVPIEKVKEIVRLPEITPVPETPDFIEGVINLRGKIIPVVDMRMRLGIRAAEKTRAARILVIDINGRIVGLIVDAASEILKIPDESIEPPPELVSSIGAEYITAVGKLKDKLIVLLDLQKLLSPEEMKRVDVVHKKLYAEKAILSEGKEKALEQGSPKEA